MVRGQRPQYRGLKYTHRADAHPGPVWELETRSAVLIIRHCWAKSKDFLIQPKVKKTSTKDASIKLGAVACHVVGQSGRAMLRAMAVEKQIDVNREVVL